MFKRATYLVLLAAGIPAQAQRNAPTSDPRSSADPERSVWIEFDQDGLDEVFVLGSSSSGDDRPYRSVGHQRFADVPALVGLSDDGGTEKLYNGAGGQTIELDGAGSIAVDNDLSEQTVCIIGDESDDAGQIVISDRNGSTVRNAITLISRDSIGTGDEIIMVGTGGTVTVDIDGTTVVAASSSTGAMARSPGTSSVPTTRSTTAPARRRSHSIGSPARRARSSNCRATANGSSTRWNPPRSGSRTSVPASS